MASFAPNYSFETAFYISTCCLHNLVANGGRQSLDTFMGLLACLPLQNTLHGKIHRS